MYESSRKASLGTRYTCYTCGTKFYDLNRPDPICPECSADQREAPVRDVHSLLLSTKGKRRAPVPDEEEEETSSSTDDDDDDDNEFFSVLDGDDDDGDDEDLDD